MEKGPEKSPGKNTSVDCHAFSPRGSSLEKILTQRLNPGLPHCRWIYCIADSLPSEPLGKSEKHTGRHNSLKGYIRFNFNLLILLFFLFIYVASTTKLKLILIL